MDKEERKQAARELGAIVAHNLKTIRKNRKLSQEELAALTDLSVNEIGRIERNKTVPGLEVISVLSRGLDIPPERLLDSRLDPTAVFLSTSSRRFPLEALIEDLPHAEQQFILRVAGSLAAHYREQHRDPGKLYID